MSTSRHNDDAGAYTERFYEGQLGSGDSVKAVVPLVLDLAPIESVLDVGCGVGHWLAGFAEAGVSDLMGIDRDEVPVHLLQIPTSGIERVDLSRPFDLGRTFDLVVSLEVAEHLPAASADGFVASIAAHGDLVLFSAAIPGQGGVSHINEQWAHYWSALFAKSGFEVLDPIRPLIWDRDDVAYCYAQNCLVYARGEAFDALVAAGHACAQVLDVVHPELWNLARQPVGLRDLARQVPHTARKTFDHYLHRVVARRNP